jgi:hypothetical protein
VPPDDLTADNIDKFPPTDDDDTPIVTDFNPPPEDIRPEKDKVDQFPPPPHDPG